jgi:hypothetical protein
MLPLAAGWDSPRSAKGREKALVRVWMSRNDRAAMKIHIKLDLLLALALALQALPCFAQTTNKSATVKKPVATGNETARPEAKAKSAHPIHGKLAAVDKSGMTITVGKTTYALNSETKIKNAGAPATLADATIGGEVSGYVKPNADGKMVLSSLNLGPRSPAEKSEKKKTK